ncbi:N-acetyltransferase 8-like 2 [Mastacembelus armatus]|uniref:N-acetyltransferase 8-like 2 n=1 Tax=Mastacembelus armatus TaxID=205130 RepID=UPI000E45622C|nr:putative N-acetyltransferase 8B [Mastacembelus armatus]XP_026163292.1 putative N-acetyltransferase 8B [Mastacembelus armatus]
MQPVIRRYRPSDKDTVLSLFSTCTWEHIWPCFHNAVTSPLYLAITLALCVAGYLLGFVLGAVMLPAVWVGLVFCCCHETYAGYVRERLRTDMQDIPGNFLSRPDDCFWVAEAELYGRVQIVGMVAVVGRQKGKEKFGQLFRMNTSPLCRRMGLGIRLVQTVVDFCKQQGFSKVVLETSSIQMAGLALYQKMGFCHVPLCTGAESSWLFRLARVTIIQMEKQL